MPWGWRRLSIRPTLGAFEDAPTIDELTRKAVDFLRPRQAADGSWSADRKEPGITALVVTALLRSRRVTPADPAVTKGAGATSSGSSAPRAGSPRPPHANYTTSIALMAFQEANTGRPVRPRHQGGPGLPQDDAVGRGRGQGPRQTPSTAAPATAASNSRPDLSNTAFMHRGPARHRPARRRPGLEEGAGLRLAVPEPQERVQRPALGRQGQRRRLHLHRRQRRRRASPARPTTAASARTPA